MQQKWKGSGSLEKATLIFARPCVFIRPELLAQFLTNFQTGCSLHFVLLYTFLSGKTRNCAPCWSCLRAAYHLYKRCGQRWDKYGFSLSARQSRSFRKVGRNYAICCSILGPCVD